MCSNTRTWTRRRRYADAALTSAVSTWTFAGRVAEAGVRAARLAYWRGCRVCALRRPPIHSEYTSSAMDSTPTAVASAAQGSIDPPEAVEHYPYRVRQTPKRPGRPKTTWAPDRASRVDRGLGDTRPVS